jgi:hypothetical protein
LVSHGTKKRIMKARSPSSWVLSMIPPPLKPDSRQQN